MIYLYIYIHIYTYKIHIYTRDKLPKGCKYTNEHLAPALSKVILKN